ncbi:preprotein translocase, SecE subunit [delta proteobacterium NaphS2]|nr:preprotein translocase, SecE subunit [delta proteobacterium NaphS2]
MKKNNRKPKSKKTPKKKVMNSGDAASVSAFESAGGGGQKTGKTARAVQKASKPAKTGEGGGASNLFKTVGLFLRQAKVELKKVKWPTRKELIASTVVVIVLTILVSFYLGLIDLGLIKIIKHVIG